MDFPGRQQGSFTHSDLERETESDEIGHEAKRPRLSQDPHANGVDGVPHIRDLQFDGLDSDDFGYLDQLMQQPTPDRPHVVSNDRPHEPARQIGKVYDIAGERVFIPNSPGLAWASIESERQDNLVRTTYTVEHCLQRALEMFPDIEHDYVRKLYDDFSAQANYETSPGPARLEKIIQKLLEDPDWPKQPRQSQTQRKRKREAGTDEITDLNIWDHPNRPPPRAQTGVVLAILKAEFPDIPRKFIASRIPQGAHLYQAYVALAKAKDEQRAGQNLYGRGWRDVSTVRDGDASAREFHRADLLPELQAARDHVDAARKKAAADIAQKRAEAEELERAKLAGEMRECQACFEVLEMSRQMHCDGAEPHFVCLECAETYIKTEVGQNRSRTLCVGGCGAAYTHSQLNLLDDKELLERLAKIQQEKDIREAKIDGLEECPFCDYKAICLPIEQDFEFHCANPECEKISCRRCRNVSHIPSSCDEHAQNRGITSRHRLEEAMTAALVRSCNKCRNPFIKTDGCNKMTCTRCGNVQCYACSEDIKDYTHFDNSHQSRAHAIAQKCPLYDDVDARHQQEVKVAEDSVRAGLLKDNPGMSVDELQIKFSDSVKEDLAKKTARSDDPYMADRVRVHEERRRRRQAAALLTQHRRNVARTRQGRQEINPEANADRQFPRDFLHGDLERGPPLPAPPPLQLQIQEQIGKVVRPQENYGPALAPIPARDHAQEMLRDNRRRGPETKPYGLLDDAVLRAHKNSAPSGLHERFNTVAENAPNPASGDRAAGQENYADHFPAAEFQVFNNLPDNGLDELELLFPGYNDLAMPGPLQPLLPPPLPVPPPPRETARPLTQPFTDLLEDRRPQHIVDGTPRVPPDEQDPSRLAFVPDWLNQVVQPGSGMQQLRNSANSVALTNQNQQQQRPLSLAQTNPRQGDDTRAPSVQGQWPDYETFLRAMPRHGLDRQ